MAVTAPGEWALAEDLVAAGVSVDSIPVRMCWLVQYGHQPLSRQAARSVRYALPDPGFGDLRNWLARERPDAVHVNCLPHLRGAGAARACGLPVVWHLREILPPGPRRRWYAARLRRDATRIVAVSEAVADWVREEGLSDLVEVVHNGVSPPATLPDRNTARMALGLPPNACVVGIFSQVVEHKGALDFVRAAAIAAGRSPDMHFLIAGHGPTDFVSRLDREIERSSAAGRVHRVPPQPDIWSMLSAVDLVALTTLWPDPLPRVIMEAMAAAKPVVAYDGGGVPEMLVDGENGFIVDTGDTDGLADGIIRLAEDRELMEAFGTAGNRRALNRFSVADHVGKMETIFEKVASVQS